MHTRVNNFMNTRFSKDSKILSLLESESSDSNKEDQNDSIK